MGSINFQESSQVIGFTKAAILYFFRFFITNNHLLTKHLSMLLKSESAVGI